MKRGVTKVYYEEFLQKNNDVDYYDEDYNYYNYDDYDYYYDYYY